MRPTSLTLFENQAQNRGQAYFKDRLQSGRNIRGSPPCLKWVYRIIVANNPINFIDPEGLQTVFLGSSTMLWARPAPLIRPVPWRLAPNQQYTPRITPRPTPNPRLQPRFEPPPRIVRPQPKPWWYWLLRGIRVGEKIEDPLGLGH